MAANCSAAETELATAAGVIVRPRFPSELCSLSRMGPTDIPRVAILRRSGHLSAGIMYPRWWCSLEV